jgi:hypothetical protein
MRQVEAATPRHQQLSSERRHALVNRDRNICARQNLGGHQARRSATHDCRFAIVCHHLDVTAPTLWGKPRKLP